MTRTTLRLLIVTAVLAIAVAGPSVAGAETNGCGAEGTIFMGPANEPQTHGDQGIVLVRNHNGLPGCTVGDTIGGGTIIEGIGGSSIFPNEWLEIGWRVDWGAIGARAYYLFYEHGSRGVADTYHQAGSACAVEGTLVTFKVVRLTSPSTTWSVWYACNGGGWNDWHHQAGTGSSWGNAKGETFRQGTTPMDETHQALQWKTATTDVWHTTWVGTPICQQPLGAPGGWGIIIDSSSKYRTVPSSQSTYCEF